MSKRLSVVFRIYSDSLDPEEMSRHLEMEATELTRKGEVKAIHPSESNIWGYEIQHDEQQDLEGVISATLAGLRPAVSRIRALAGRAEPVLWCAIFTDDPEATVVLSPLVMGEMNEFGAEFHCSVYQVEFEADEGGAR